jgi:predicted permease
MSFVDFLYHPENIILFKAVARLFVISLIGFVAVRSKLLSTKAIQCLSSFVISIALPSLIISSLAKNLNYQILGSLGYCFMAALMLNGLALLAALAVRRIFLSSAQKGKGIFISLSAIQNSGYLPIPLATAILPIDQAATGLLFIFVYIFVMGFIFWSLGVWLISGKKGPETFKGVLLKTLNPPLIAMVAGLLFVVQPVKKAINTMSLLLEALTTIGETTVPLVLIILGGSFAVIYEKNDNKGMIGLAAVMKLICVPAVALSAAVVFELEKIFAFALILQAAMPAAMNHIVVAQQFEGDVPLTSQALFVQYLLSLVTVPFFIIIYNWLYI